CLVLNDTVKVTMIRWRVLNKAVKTPLDMTPQSAAGARVGLTPEAADDRCRMDQRSSAASGVRPTLAPAALCGVISSGVLAALLRTRHLIIVTFTVSFRTRQ